MTGFSLQSGKPVEQYRSLQKAKIGKLFCIFCASSSRNDVFFVVHQGEFRNWHGICIKKARTEISDLFSFLQEDSLPESLPFFLFISVPFPVFAFRVAYFVLKTGAWSFELFCSPGCLFWRDKERKRERTGWSQRFLTGKKGAGVLQASPWPLKKEMA